MSTIIVNLRLCFILLDVGDQDLLLCERNIYIYVYIYILWQIADVCILYCIDDCFVESKSFQLDNVCCVLEMALTVTMASGTLKDNQKILVVRLLALNFRLTVVYSESLNLLTWWDIFVG